MTWGDVVKSALDALFIFLGYLAMKQKMDLVQNSSASHEQLSRVHTDVIAAKTAAEATAKVIVPASIEDRGPGKP